MPSAFKDYLMQKALIKDKYIPFYLKWASDCYVFLNMPDSQIVNSEQENLFLKHLSKTHEDWQVKQADNALRLYGYFLSSLQKGNSARLPEVETEWNLLETRTQESSNHHGLYPHCLKKYIKGAGPSGYINFL